ncbi:MAG: hypothetical protein U1E25_03300 [Methylocystis sp.]
MRRFTSAIKVIDQFFYHFRRDADRRRDRFAQTMPPSSPPSANTAVATSNTLTIAAKRRRQTKNFRRIELMRRQRQLLRGRIVSVDTFGLNDRDGWAPAASSRVDENNASVIIVHQRVSEINAANAE